MDASAMMTMITIAPIFFILLFIFITLPLAHKFGTTPNKKDLEWLDSADLIAFQSSLPISNFTGIEISYIPTPATTTYLWNMFEK